MFEKYGRMRKGLGVFAVVVLIAAIFVGTYVEKRSYPEQEASFAYNFCFVLLVLWINVSGLAKALMAIGEKGFRIINIIAVLLFSATLLGVTQIPSAGTAAPDTIAYHLFSWLTLLWMFSWTAFDVFEIATSIVEEAEQISIRTV